MPGDPLHPTNAPLPTGCPFPVMAVVEDGEIAVSSVPEAEDAAQSAARIIGERVRAGRAKYGISNVEASPLHLIRMAKEEIADCWAYLEWAEQQFIARGIE